MTDKRDTKAERRRIYASTALASDRMIESACASDLVMMARPDGDYDRPVQRFALDQVIRKRGRSVLLVPDRSLGKRALIAHACTQKSARAAVDLLLEPRAEVHIVHVGDEPDELRSWTMTELGAAVSRHAYDVTTSHRPRRDKSIGATLLEVGAEVDVIAAGAYGQSRSYAFSLGDRTGDPIRETRVPVFFSA